MAVDARTIKLISMSFPLSVSTNPLHVKPLDRTADKTIHLSLGDKVGHAKIKSALNTYRLARCYIQAVAKGTKLVDILGKEIRNPTPEEINVAAQWLQNYNLDRILETDFTALAEQESREIIPILERDYQELKALSGQYTKNKSQRKTLELRRTWVRVAHALAAIDPTDQRLKALRYAEYYYHASHCIVHTVGGSFDLARVEAQSALEKAGEFISSNHFFPNVFKDSTDIASYGVYINALEAFRTGDFNSASVHFKNWLILNEHWASKGDARYDSTVFNQEICEFLSRVKERGEVEFRSVEKLLQSTSLNIYRTSRALWDRLQQIGIALQNTTSNEHWRKVQDNWPLLTIYAPLHDKERSASLEEAVRLPIVLDLASILGNLGDKWRFVAWQWLRNSLILKADYHSLFLKYDVGAGVSVSHKASYQICALSDNQLLEYLPSVMSGAERKLVFPRWSKLWHEARSLVDHESEAVVVDAVQKFFDVLRSFPHIVKVIGEAPIAPARPGKRWRMLKLDRQWNLLPKNLELETDWPIEVGSYAYMRPRWNRSLKRSYRLNRRGDDPLIPCRTPEWMSTFERWVRGLGSVDCIRFLTWLEQIENKRRAVALRLLSRLCFIDDAGVIDLWRRLFRSLPVSAKVRNAIYVPVGGLHKSGTHHLYYLGRALKELGESERLFDLKEAFVTSESLPQSGDDINTVVFVDDVSGSGDQMKEYVGDIFHRHPWLKEKEVFVATLIGFRQAKEAIELDGDIPNVRVFFGRTLEERDRAFSEENPLWENDEDRISASEWATGVGAALLANYEGLVPERDALGYKNGQALISFPYNTPNNTLPLFWAEGHARGREWKSLLTRG